MTRATTTGGRTARRLTRGGYITGVAAAAALALALVAQALWSDHGTGTGGSMEIGSVRFGATTEDGTPSIPADSEAGGAVTVTLPGSTIVEVLDQSGLDPDPVIWRISASGYAQGITGLVYDLTVTDQVHRDGSVTSLSTGVGADGTILALSTMKVYPASVNGDCSSVPATPEGGTQNVYVFDGDGRVLQAAGAYAGGPTAQDWCVAIVFNSPQDGGYANEAKASGTDEAGHLSRAMDRWSAAVAFPPSLSSVGAYTNRVDALGLAEDGTYSRDRDWWGATLFPDPTLEPDVTITLDPTVTNLNPQVATGDHFELLP